MAVREGIAMTQQKNSNFSKIVMFVNILTLTGNVTGRFGSFFDESHGDRQKIVHALFLAIFRGIRLSKNR